MNRSIAILVAIFALFTSIAAIAAGQSSDPAKAAEQFYAGYLTLVNASKDTTSWVAKSHLVTANFKKSYAKKMSAEDVDADPAIQAQDTPTSPFKATKTTIDGKKATVILTAKYANATHKLSVNMLLTNGVWQLDAVSPVK
jgi:hypothetical protein